MVWQEHRIQSAIDGTNPMIIAELKGGFVAFGDTQFLPGYCVLLPKIEVASLNDLGPCDRQLFLSDMAFVGDAILSTCHPTRINYDILGNTDKFLHAHIFPRYDWEDDTRRRMPVWLYPQSHWQEESFLYSPEEHDTLRAAITQYIDDYYKND